MTIDWQEFRDRLIDAKSIILSTHKNPDGDGLGSEIAMFYYLKNINKDVRIINYSETPERYKFMDPNSSIETYAPEIHDKWISNADLVIVFDLGDYLRLCDLGDSIKNNNIDVIYIIYPQKSSVIYDYIDKSCFEEIKISKILTSFELKNCSEIK